jgi:hypothetical protein
MKSSCCLLPCLSVSFQILNLWCERYTNRGHPGDFCFLPAKRNRHYRYLLQVLELIYGNRYQKTMQRMLWQNFGRTYNNDMVVPRKLGCRIMTRPNEPLALQMRKRVLRDIFNIPMYCVLNIDCK